MIVQLASLRLDPGPGSLCNIHADFDYVRVGGQVVIAQ